MFEGIQKSEETQKETHEVMGELIIRIMDEAEQYEIKPEDRNEKGELLVSPDGAISNLGKQSELWWKIARTESFKKWFGDWKNDSKNSSKIVDRNGEPFALFRGVEKDLSLTDFYNKNFYYNREFETQENKMLPFGKTKSLDLGSGVYMTASHEMAIDYGNLFPAFVNSRQPKYDESNLDAFEDIVNNIVLYFPRKLIKEIPRVSFTSYDSIFGKSNAQKHSSVSHIKATTPEDLYEIVIKDPKQVLIIPNPTPKV